MSDREGGPVRRAMIAPRQWLMTVGRRRDILLALLLAVAAIILVGAAIPLLLRNI
ncbi:MAG: hypothetical protein ACE5MB_05430 [Anaerolineae bacterium]